MRQRGSTAPAETLAEATAVSPALAVLEPEESAPAAELTDEEEDSEGASVPEAQPAKARAQSIRLIVEKNLGAEADSGMAGFASLDASNWVGMCSIG